MVTKLLRWDLQVKIAVIQPLVNICAAFIPDVIMHQLHLSSKTFEFNDVIKCKNTQILTK